jgi:hypothetical protein
MKWIDFNLKRVNFTLFKKVKVKWSRYRPGVAQRVGRGIALLLHDRGTRMGWVVSSTPRPHFTSGKEPVPIVQGAGWAPGPVWTSGKSRPYRDSIPDRPARSSVAIQIELPDPQRYRITSPMTKCKFDNTKNKETSNHFRSTDWTPSALFASPRLDRKLCRHSWDIIRTGDLAFSNLCTCWVECTPCGVCDLID